MQVEQLIVVREKAGFHPGPADLTEVTSSLFASIFSFIKGDDYIINTKGY